MREPSSASETRIERDVFETPYAESAPGLVHSSLQRMKGDAVKLDLEQAFVVARQIEESASVRGWSLLAGSVMANHVHLVVGLLGDPEPSAMLKTFKSYASRSLNERWTKPSSGTWWTESGSTRKLPDDRAVEAAIRYVREQEFVLARCEAK